MSNRLFALSAAAALSLAALASSPASAEEAGSVYGKGVGALSFETRGVATSPADVRRQGGFASAGAAQWKAPAQLGTQAGAAYGGTVGALALETRGRPTNGAEVRGQGGAITASAVRWTSAPAR